MYPASSGSGIQDDNKYAASVSKSGLDVVQFKATIPTVPVSLPGGTNEAYSLVFVGTVNQPPNGTSQAQMGYGKSRTAGSSRVQEFVYCEVYHKDNNGNITDRFFYTTASYPTGDNEYKGILDKTTGKWTFYLNGTALTNSGNKTYWVGETGEALIVQAEIFNKYSQGVGTSTAKCSVSNAQAMDSNGINHLLPSGTSTNSTHPDLKISVPGTGEVVFYDQEP